MTERGSTIGAGGVFWERISAGTDGEQISLLIQAYFSSHHTPYLNEILASRFEGLFGDAEVKFRLDPGNVEVDGHGHLYYEKEGKIVITGIQEPWPDGAALRKALDEALSEPGAVEVEQMNRADDLVKHLRETGQR